MAKLKSILKGLLVLTLWLASTHNMKGQNNPRQLADFILAVVGDQVVLRSEFDAEVQQIAQDGTVVTEEMKCVIFEELLKRKLMIHQAEIDSIPVSDEQVEDELNRRLGYFAAQMGGEKKLEEYLGKSLTEYKKEMRPKMRAQLLSRSMEAKITGDLKVSPSEVREYFNKIPKDSIPLIKAEFEIGQIVIKPQASDLAREYALESIKKIREDIVLRGADFAKMARNFSEDRYSAERGGSLGEFGRGDMVPEFERAAFKLQKDSISPIIETKFGFHIIKLIERRGERVICLHILVRPKVTSYDIQDAIKLSDSIRNAFIEDPSSFCELATKFSEDDDTRRTCGMFNDPQTGSTKISIEYIDNQMSNVISKLKPGQISQSEVIDLPDGTKGIRLFYLKSEIMPHRANLNDDYPKIQFTALEQKREEVMQQWVMKKIKTMYVDINDEYLKCDFIDKWNNKDRKEQ
ncbi:MAG: peptidylprolyl isomerase [Bacteroidia bacterium]|jgi:peptidyl-prolyl cis-trans isomerase SurA|nr:peptidylprolyl isomerase [Bacteroidia bacterium]MCO5252821.1 peptidylprolyl isomerase [Bacteroidota bacterium]MCZ2131438.1 peptidylprolyl isomerase [Bacteroidia bacterium]